MIDSSSGTEQQSNVQEHGQRKQTAMPLIIYLVQSRTRAKDCIYKTHLHNYTFHPELN